MPFHHYALTVSWTGNLGTGTSSYRAYDRAHELTAHGKGVIAGSSDPQFRGDPTRYNPEELLVGSLSACHMLWYLHVCAEAGVVVEHYVDQAEGVMHTDADGGGHFTEVVLRPRCTYRELVESARIADLHAAAHARCFVANSMNFPVRVEPNDA